MSHRLLLAQFGAQRGTTRRKPFVLRTQGHRRQHFVGAVECGNAGLEHFHVSTFGLRKPIHHIGFGYQLGRALLTAQSCSSQAEK